MSACMYHGDHDVIIIAGIFIAKTAMCRLSIGKKVPARGMSHDPLDGT